MVDLDPAASAMPGSGEKSLAQPSGGRRRGRPKGSGNKAAQCERRASLPARLASRRRQALGAWAGEIDKGIAAPRRVGCKSLVFNSVATIPAGHRPPMHLNERAMFRRHARHAEVGCSRLRQIIIGPSRKHPTWTARDPFPGPRRPSRFAAWSRALPEPQNLVALRTGGAAFVGGVKIDKGAPAFRRVCCKSPVFKFTDQPRRVGKIECCGREAYPERCAILPTRRAKHPRAHGACRAFCAPYRIAPTPAGRRPMFVADFARGRAEHAALTRRSISPRRPICTSSGSRRRSSAARPRSG